MFGSTLLDLLVLAVAAVAVAVVMARKQAERRRADEEIARRADRQKAQLDARRRR